MTYPKLSEALQVGNLLIPNRIVMPPLVIFAAGEDALVTDRHVEHYRRSAGPGLMIVEATVVLLEGRLHNRQLGIYDDAQAEGLARLVEVIHAGGAAAGIQIHHAGEKSVGVVAADEQSDAATGGGWDLQNADLECVKLAFADACRRTVQAGFDMVELHAAHGYLFSQLLSPRRNKRTDRHGGSLENRRRLLLETHRAAQGAVGKQILVTCRFGVADGGSGGLSLEEGQETARELVDQGARLLDVSSGMSAPRKVQPEGSPFSPIMHLAQAVKQTVSVPVIGVSGIRHPDQAEQALEDGMADLIAVGRGMLADPAWARKAIAGRAEDIAPCRECRPCFHFTEPEKCPARKVG